MAAELKLIRERMTMAGQMHEKELALLNARIEELRQDRADLRTERDSLLKTLQEQAVSVRLLTDQRPSSPPPARLPVHHPLKPASVDSSLGSEKQAETARLEPQKAENRVSAFLPSPFRLKRRRPSQGV